jgi:hypothetical protein
MLTGDEIVAITIVSVLAFGIFVPKVLRELSNLLGRNPVVSQEGQKATAEGLKKLQDDVEQMRLVYTEKILSLEKRVRALESSRGAASIPAAGVSRTMSEREQGETQSDPNNAIRQVEGA